MVLYFYYPAFHNYKGGEHKPPGPKGVSWKAIQQERKVKVEKVCRKFNETQSQPINYGRYLITFSNIKNSPSNYRFFYSPDYNLMFCSNAKVGSTTSFMTTFSQILYGKDQMERTHG